MTRCREVAPDLWEAACAATAFVPLQQSAAYAAALARRGRIVRRWLIEGADGRILYGMQAATRRIAGFSALTTALRGPFPFRTDALAAGSAPLAAAIGARSRHWPHALICAPELDDGPAATQALRDARLRRVMTPQALAQVDLHGDKAGLRRRLDGKWRNRLVKAEAAGLRVDIARGGAAMTWLCAAHGRLMRRGGEEAREPRPASEPRAVLRSLHRRPRAAAPHRARAVRLTRPFPRGA
jgi:hypothetical protein